MESASIREQADAPGVRRRVSDLDTPAARARQSGEFLTRGGGIPGEMSLDQAAEDEVAVESHCC